MIARAAATALALVAALSAAPAAARSPVNAWLCEVLKAPFDAPAAMAAFPLEQLGAASEDRFTDKDDDGTPRTAVTVTADGRAYHVELNYMYRKPDQSDAYGFVLRVSQQFLASGDFAGQSEAWLEEFGKTQKSDQGRMVAAAALVYPGGPPRFSIERWNDAGVYLANWWNPGDIALSAELCK